MELSSKDNNNNNNPNNEFLDVDVDCDCMVELIEWLVTKLNHKNTKPDLTNNHTKDNDVEVFDKEGHTGVFDYINSLENHLSKLESNINQFKNDNNNICSKCNQNILDETNSKSLTRQNSIETPDLIPDKINDSINPQSEYQSPDLINQKSHSSFSLMNKKTEFKSADNILENNTQKSFYIKDPMKKSFTIDITSEFESLNINSEYNLEEIFSKDSGFFDNDNIDFKNVSQALLLKLKQKDNNIIELNKQLESCRNIIEKMKATRDEWYENMSKELKNGFDKKIKEYKNKECHIIKSQTNELEYMKAKLEMYRIKVKQLSDAVGHFIPVDALKLPECVNQSYYDETKPSFFSNKVEPSFEQSNKNMNKTFATSSNQGRDRKFSTLPKHRYSHSTATSKNSLKSQSSELATNSKAQLSKRNNNVKPVSNKTSTNIDTTKSSKKQLFSLPTKSNNNSKESQISKNSGGHSGLLKKRAPIKYSTNL